MHDIERLIDCTDEELLELLDLSNEYILFFKKRANHKYWAFENVFRKKRGKEKWYKNFFVHMFDISRMCQ